MKKSKAKQGATSEIFKDLFNYGSSMYKPGDYVLTGGKKLIDEFNKVLKEEGLRNGCKFGGGSTI